MPNSFGTSPVVGKWSAHVQVNGAGQSGDRLIITATKGDIFELDEILHIVGVEDVDPLTLTPGGAKPFRVTERLVAKGNGLDVLHVHPALIGPGQQYQNVSALPASGALLIQIA